MHWVAVAVAFVPVLEVGRLYMCDNFGSNYIGHVICGY